MALTAAGVGSSTPSSTSSPTVSVSSTGGAGRLLIIVCSEANNATPATVASISGLGGTWVKRAAITIGTHGQSTELWYADLAASTSGTVTVTMSKSIDDAVLMAVIVASTIAAPISFDANASLPGTVSGTGATTGTVAISTNSSAPYVVVMTGATGSGTPTSPTPVSTALESGSNTGGTLNEFGRIDGGTPGRLSSTATGYSTTPGSTQWTTIVDALTDAPVASSGGNMLAVMGL